jgi:alginate O-acetyltransferase complex protein AlgI
MLFNSVNFLIFFPIVVLAYFVVPKKIKNFWLLLASYFFYGSFGWVYSLLLLFSTVTTFVSAVFIDRAKSKKRKKFFLVLNIILNLAILFYFKYFDFFISSISAIFPQLSSLPSKHSVAGVVGISFYTLQSLGYTIDVYKGTVKREKNFLQYALFVSFFPQLVAGPIERSKNLLPQLSHTYKFDYDRVTDGLVMMTWGFFKKVVVADGAAQLVDVFYSRHMDFDGLSMVIGTILFAFQIYGDFSGYSDIAIGAAKVLGIDLMENFNRPYFTTSFKDFWDRWHISLTSWLTEYIYIPLGGSKNGMPRTCLNVMIVFLISGLWHGASLTFVLWGAINGLYRMTEMLIQKSKNREKVNNNVGKQPLKFLRQLKVFLRICLSYVFFRRESVDSAFNILKNIFTNTHISLLFSSQYNVALLNTLDITAFRFFMLLFCIAFMMIVEKHWGDYRLPQKVNSKHAPERWLFYYAQLLLLLFFGNFGQSPFIYFKF